jgi:AhpD family alkylhydroperoxidase
MTAPFRKRTYRGIGELVSDLAFVAGRLKPALSIGGGRGLPHAFRERLMLVVTGVNECRYCTFLHSAAARGTGIPDEQVRQLLSGKIDVAPADEIPALRYALEWAETDGRPPLDAWHELASTYGAERARLIELALRLIRIGNLTGNTLDRGLHKVGLSGRETTAQR